MSDSETLDLLGYPVLIGDRVAVAFRSGNTAEMRVGTVVEFATRKTQWGPVETMRVSWEKGSERLPESKITAIDKFARVFVKLS
jgi:hypothetical protein